jgi:hypothetical protein
MGRPNKHKTPAPRPPVRKEDAAARGSSSADVFATVVAVVVSVLVGVAWLTPVIVTAPYVLYLRRVPSTGGLFRRWAITVLVATAVAASFVPWHTFESVLMGHSMPHQTRLWMRGEAGPPLGARFMLVTGVLYAVAALAGAGVGGALVFSAALSINAVYAVNLTANGFNLVQVALVAIPPWQWCFLAGLYVLFEPLAAISRRRVIRRGSAGGAAGASTRTIAIGVGLVAVAVLLRLVATGAYTALVRRWTVF